MSSHLRNKSKAPRPRRQNPKFGCQELSPECALEVVGTYSGEDARAFFKLQLGQHIGEPSLAALVTAVWAGVHAVCGGNAYQLSTAADLIAAASTGVAAFNTESAKRAFEEGKEI